MHDTWWIVRRGVDLVVHLRLLSCVKSHSRKGVRADDLYALDAVQRQTVLGKQKLPALDSETRLVRIDEALVIGVHNDLEARHHGAILAKSSSTIDRSASSIVV